MNIGIWIAIALVCFVLPATALTNGGNRDPQKAKLAQYAKQVGLPLPPELIAPVAARLKRRQRGILIGGITGIVVATFLYIVFFDNDDGAAPALVIVLTAMGLAFGGAWAIAAHHPGENTDQPVVARMRSVTLLDYLTKGERAGYWLVPAVVVAGTIAGPVLLAQLPNIVPHTRPLGLGLAIAALVTWGIAAFALQKVLAAPARSQTDLELAWDDAERADGLRQVVNLSVAVACLSLLFWLIFIGQAILFAGFYQDDPQLAGIVTATSVGIFGILILVVAAGPVLAWLTGARKGYEQRRLWPNGARS